MLRTPLCDWHKAHSARMVEFAGWEMPIQYTSIVEEHTAVRERVGLFDIGHMGRVFFCGPDAMSFLDHLVTTDVTRLKTGQARYALVLNRGGGILDDVLVYRLDGGVHLLVVNASNREKILAWIEHHLEGYTLSAADQTQDRFMFALQGPRAVQVLAPLCEGDVASLGYYTACSGKIAGVEAIISRTGYTGEDGFEVIVPRAAAVSTWERIFQAGQPAGLTACGLGCRDTLRLEAAMPLYGHEMDESIDPYSAGLGFGVKLKKGDFIGRAAVAAKAAEANLPRRVGLELAGKRIAREGSQVYSGDRQVGRVTSGTFSPTLQKSIAMGFVPHDLAAEGTAVEVDIRGKREAARVVKLPFYRRASTAT
jgi:aminomethyltransferase